MNYWKLFGFIIPVLLIGCGEEEPPRADNWYKGNLHTHSYWSDGDEFPEVIMDWYKSNDYQFVALTDHNTLAEGEKWKRIPEDTIYQEAFDAYLQEYGEDWVIYRNDSLGQIEVRLKTFEEYRGLFEENEQFLVIQAEEITDRFDGRPLHMNASNLVRKIEPQGGNSVSEVLQNNIDAVIAQRDEEGRPMLPHINHPNFGFAISLEDMIALENERFFEVYNGHHLVHNSGDSTHMSTEEMWDRINIAYYRDGKPLMYGIATDDSHNYHRQGRQWSNAGRGWVMVNADSLDASALIGGMEAGEFYATTGVNFEQIWLDDEILRVKVVGEPGETFTITFLGARKGSSEPEEFVTIEGSEASFEVTDDIAFVRCKVISSRLQENPIEDLIYEMAWTQPVTGNQ